MQAQVYCFDPLFVAFAYIRLTCALRCSCRAMMGAFRFRLNPVDTAYMVKAPCHILVWLCLVPVSAPHKEDKWSLSTSVPADHTPSTLGTLDCMPYSLPCVRALRGMRQQLNVILLQDHGVLRNATLMATVIGPITLGGDALLEEVAMATVKVDDAVWSGNDTTGQANKSAGRAGGRAKVSWNLEDLGGANLLRPCQPA
jgi:hypothetical protein